MLVLKSVLTLPAQTALIGSTGFLALLVELSKTQTRDLADAKL